MLIPKIDDTTADLLVAYYKNPEAVELPDSLRQIATQVAQIKMLFADQWKRRDIVQHLMSKEAWNLDERTAYNRVALATRCFPDITESYIDMEIQLLLDFQLDIMSKAFGDPKLLVATMKERRLLLSFLKNKIESKEPTRTSSVINNYIMIQNNGGLPTMVNERDIAAMDIDARNVLTRKAQEKMLPTSFLDLLPVDEKAKHV